MKRYTWFTIMITALALTFTGCSKKEPTVETEKLEQSFQTADNSSKAVANEAVVAIQSGDYKEALVQLKKLAAQAKLTDEQKNAVKDTIDQIKTVWTDAAKDAADSANKAVGDLQKSITK